MKVETGYHHFGLLTLHVLIYNSVWGIDHCWKCLYGGIKWCAGVK